MSVLRGVRDRRFQFTQVLNSMLEDSELSLKAKGFITYCLSKTNDWRFYVEYLVSKLKEGEDAIYSTIKECERLGYAFRYQPRNEKGQMEGWETIISDSKEEIEKLKIELGFKNSLPDRDFPDSGLPDPGNHPPSNNNSTDIQKEEVVCSAPPPVAALTPSKHQSEFCEKIHPDGHILKVSKQELISEFIRKKLDFDLIEIDEAWNILVDCKQVIRDPVRYVEGTINQIRNSKTHPIITAKDQEKKKCNHNSQKNQSKTSQSPCKVVSLGLGIRGQHLQT